MSPFEDINGFPKKNALSRDIAKASYSLRSVLLQGYDVHGIEMEISNHCVNALKLPMYPGSTFVPNSILSRDLSVASDGQLVETEVEKTVIDALIPVSTAVKAGAIVLEPDRNSVSLPRISTGTIPGWAQENVAPSAVGSNGVAYSTVVLNPVILTSQIYISKQLLVQATPSIEQFRSVAVLCG
jgi:hypothetical protein